MNDTNRCYELCTMHLGSSDMSGFEEPGSWALMRYVILCVHKALCPNRVLLL